MYLTHTGIVNEAGIAMDNTVGKYSYRFVCIPLDQNCTLTVLCSEFLVVEDLVEYINYEMSQCDFLKKLEEKPAIEKAENLP